MSQITKAGIFSIVGRPNVGKSTLTNELCGVKVAIVSNKPQTTRTRITGVLNSDDCQLIFLDTPGLHKPRTRLGETMVRVINETVTDVDTVVLVVEPVPRIGIPEQMLIDKINEFHLPAILVINKIDTVKKESLLEVMAAYQNACSFDAVVPIAASRGEGLDVLLDELKKHCQPSPQLFPDGMVSDQPERQLVAEVIREKLLMALDKEVPHGIAVEIEKYVEREDGLMEIGAVIYGERRSHKGIVIGKHGAMLKKVGAAARTEIEQMLDTKVFLELWVKVKEDWRNNVNQIRSMGLYDEP